LISEVIYDYTLVLWYNDWYENDYRRIWVPCLYKDYGFYDTPPTPVKAKLHGESKVIQRCFDDNKRRWQRWWQKAQRSIKEQLKWIKKISRVQDKNQEEFKTQEESLESRIKIQGSRSQESRSRFKNQEKA